MTDNQAKIREALRACQLFISSLNTGGEKEWEKAKDAILLLDAEEKPSVPMAMIVELAKHGSESYRKDDYYDRDTDLIEIAARYGFQVKE